MRALLDLEVTVVNGGLAPACQLGSFSDSAERGMVFGIMGGMMLGGIPGVLGGMAGGALGGVINQSFQCAAAL